MKWLRRLFSALLLCLLVFVYWLLWTPDGTRWSLTVLAHALPDLHLERIDGSWAGGVRVSHLRYSAPLVDVALTDVSLSVKPLALLAGNLALNEVAAEQVVLRLLAPEQPRPKRALPTVALPVTLSAEHITVPRFELITRGGHSVVADIRTGLRWRGTWINATDANLSAYGYHIATDLAIELRGDYAVDTALQITVPGQVHKLSAQLSGSLSELDVDGSYQGLAPLDYRAQVQLLEPGLPLWLQVSAISDTELFSGPSALLVERGELQLAGQLDNLQGALQLVTEHALAGRVELDAPLRWSEGQLRVERASVNSGHGAVSSDCTVTVSRAHWRCTGALEQLSSAQWFAAPAMVVSSAFQASGGWGDQDEVLRVALPALSGSLGSQALRGSLALSSSDWRHWQLQRLHLVAGDNVITASGSVSDDLALQLELNASALGQLSTDLSGNIYSELSVTGPLQSPLVSGSIRGRAVRWGQWALPRLRGKFELTDGGNGSLQGRLRLNKLRYGEHAVGNVQLVLTGDKARPQVALTLDGGDYQLRMRCATLSGAHWRMQCEQFEGLVALQGQPRAFAVDRPLVLEWHPSPGEFRLASNCLRMSPATLCLDQALRVRGNEVEGLVVSLRRLPLAWWYGALPAAITAKPGSYLEGSLTMTSLAPLNAVVTARIDRIDWTWRAEGSTFPASLQGIALRLALDEQRAVLRGQASSSVLGGLQVDLAVDDPRGRQALDGRLRVEQLELRTFSWLSESIQRLRGVIDGDITIAGTAAAPRLDGALVLSDGLLKDQSLPYPLERVGAKITLRNDWADVSGRFRFNDGNGRLKGRLHWQETAPKWRVDATVTTDTITVPVLDSSVAALAAHVKLGMQPGLIDIGGKVKVDSADIRLLSLPPQTISPSADAEIIGDEAPSAWQLNADLVVDLGKRVRFRGFGVDMILEGALRWRNSKRYQNRLTGEVSVARGRFRAYGQDLNIRSGRLIFAGATDNPDLQLEAVRETRDRTLIGGLRVTGSLQQPVGEFFSEPPMTDSDIAYLLLTGRRPPESGQKDGSTGGALLNLGLARTNEAAAKLASRLGIEGFQISTADGEKGIETYVSGYLSDDLYVSYGTGFEEQTASLTLQYYITPRIVIEAVGGFTSALDLVYSFRIY